MCISRHQGVALALVRVEVCTLLTPMGMAKRGLDGNRRLHAPRISPCASGNQIMTPVPATVRPSPARPSGKGAPVHYAVDDVASTGTLCGG